MPNSAHGGLYREDCWPIDRLDLAIESDEDDMTETDGNQSANTDPNAAASNPAQDAADSAGQSEQKSLDALEAEIGELKDRLLRAVAETENVRKRAERERIEAGQYAAAKFARDMLSVADNLRRALTTLGSTDHESLPEAVRNLLAGWN